VTRMVLRIAGIAIICAILSGTAFASPSITSLTPSSGAVGASVTITGTNFGSTQGTSTVTFHGITATITSWGATSIVATVPTGATTGVVVVTVSGQASGGKSFSVVAAPSITSLSPTSGAVGASVKITGTAFGSTQGTGTVTFNGTTATTITSWIGTAIYAIVPTGATTGNVVVYASGVNSNGSSFTVVSGPSITSLSTTSGAVGSTVTITGTNFGSSQGTGTVTFNGTNATTITSWGATSIVATVPTAATTGNVVVYASGVDSNGVAFTVLPTPSITSLSPTVGAVGASVTITGTNFGTSQGTSTATFNGTTATTITSWGATSIVATVPTGATTGSVQVTVSGVASNTKTFTVVPPPNMTRVSPTSGAEGTSVTITGSQFGQTQGTVMFNGTTATITSYNQNTIVATVPAGATTGNVVVYADGVDSNGVAFSVLPNITSLSPTSGAVGASVTITGTTFGTTQGTVTFNGTAASTITSWSANSIVTTVPTGATTGNVVVNASGVNSNGSAFTVVPAPSITGLLPTSDAVGASVAITGTNFGASQGSSTVTFNGTNATITTWSATSIVATVPTGATTGNVVVNASGVNSNGSVFTVVPAPSITSLSPTSGAVGASVAITGTNFGASQGSSTVTFNGTNATITTWSATSIVATVPTGATTGNVVVNASGVNSNGVSFTVQSGSFVATSGQMGTFRYGQTATQLTTGQILITGGMSTSSVASSADLYTPIGQTFAAANAMNVARWLHTATLLNDGTVLIAGGSDLANEETLDSAEIYNPSTGTFALLSNTLNTARVEHTATLLNNGQVLIVGGYDPDTGLIADAELYDPPTQTFIDLGDTNAPRYEHTATMLQNGQVLIAGGETDPIPSAAFNTAEVFDLPSQTFTLVSVPMTTMREGQAAVLLNNGQVLLTGGDVPGTGSLNTAEIYDPPSNTFTAVTSTMTVPRISHVMTVLNGGKVLIAGGATDSGSSSTTLNAAELYDPTSQTFTAVSNMTSVREHQTTSLLNDGTVLEAGGTDGINVFNTAELYTPSRLNGLASIAITPATSSIGVGGQQLFTAVGTLNDNSTQTLSSVLWSSSSAATAPISGDATNPGVAATAAQGTTTITATAAGVNGTATLTVTAPTLVSITLSPQDATVPLGATQQFTATGVYTDGSTQDLTGTATWSSSATVVAAINSSGLAAGLFQGTATIQVNFGSLSASTPLSVAAPALVSINVTPATATIALGSSQQYQATGTFSDGSTQNVTTLLTWSSGAPAVAAVTNAGLATGLSQGTATLTGTFESISASVTLTVGAPTLLSITVVPNAASLSIGATQQLSATGTYTDGTTQNLTASSTWASSNSNIIAVSNAGLATAVATGNATITATSGSASGTAVLVVTVGTTQASLNTSRYLHSSILLNNGQILVAGGINCPSAGSCTYLNSAELYSPAASAFTNTGAMATARSAPSVLLSTGKVLVAGGYNCDGSGNCSSLISAEIYDPIAGTFSSAGTMTVARSGHTMTVLGNGTVLIAGGENCTSATSCSALSSAEIYDPNSGTFTATWNSMSAARFGAGAVLLNSGSVLIAGGFDGTNLPAAAEIYNPEYHTGVGGFTWAGPNLNVPRFDATATLLNNGQVLVAGGSTCNLPGCPTNAAEIYDPVANASTLVSGGMNVARFNHSATLTTNGQVVIAGGFSSCGSSCTSEASTEFFDPAAGTFTSGQSVATGLAGHTGTLLANGNVLLIGGINAGVTLSSDEWYQPTSFTPTGLLSITVAPTSLFLMPGQSQQLVATGTFNDGSTQTLQSVIWTSSNPSAALISNSTGTAGIANAQAAAATTLTATAGDLGGSAALTVAGVVSLTITPSNPSITVGSGQQLTATGTFSDGSQQNITNSVTWSSSNNSVGLIGTTPSALPGFAMGVTSGTATITATVGSVSANASITVQSSTTPNAPNITSVSPPTGAALTQVTISGSGFGANQGTGTVWLGSTDGTVVSWSDTQIVATVAAISTSGTAQVQQGGLLSNAVTFSVTTATITNVSPASGVPGTPVTITGSGFGATPGQVWLGTANGVVQSWSDTQVVAEVASGSMSGWAQVLEGGLWSNSVSFAVNSLFISSVTPTSGGPGTSVTITGTGFGSTQGEGLVWLGGANGQVVSWSDTQVVAVVAPNSLTGVVRVEQGGVLSNAISFTVPTSGGNAVTLIPNMLNLVVGQTQAIQALNASNQPVTGLSWTSSNPTVVGLSTDDPPILTALTVGHVTIAAGTASADVTVYSATLPAGTVIWSNPGDGSGVTNIVPAVPSATGVADVFATQSDGTVQAITSNGTTAWTANLNGAYDWQIVPDFQGGLVVPKLTMPQSITKLDGITGQAYPAYTPASQNDSLSAPVVHTDGTTFTLDTNASAGTVSVIGINPTTGAQMFSVPLDQGINSQSATEYNGDGSLGFCYDSTLEYSVNSTTKTAPTVFGTPIIAGDGYAYVAYKYQNVTAVSLITLLCQGETYGQSGSASVDTVTHLMMLRVGSDGSSSKIDVKDWEAKNLTQYTFGQPYGTYGTTVNTGAIPNLTVSQVITNADQGSILTWEADAPGYCASTTSHPTVCNAQVSAATTFGLAATSGGSLSTSATMSKLFVPVLQAQDGSFYGTDYAGNMVRLSQYGNVIWSVPSDYPQIATADGGVIGSSGITYDGQGRATGQLANLPIQSWPGYAYAIGSVDQIDYSAITEANVFWPFTNFWPVANANDSGNGTAKKLPSPDANHNHTLTIREVSGQGANPFNHITVQLDNNPEVGFAPKGSGPNNRLTASETAAVLANKQVPGWVEPRGAKVDTLDAVTIYLTADEANDAQQYIINRTNNPGYYQLRGSSCVDFGELVVITTDFLPPTDALPRSLPKSIRAEQIKENTVQAP
jgi:trimeric autotransporter adhesin